ncbi:DUF722 domain-containing protein [Weissella paramesenteroides]|uniref:transcriptional regulator n=1 Tax=Weissella paramesenteroides TaxID=1249 RepID=UPI0023F8827F|nr:transcriptional regulator [Weissella paramesenteroides]MDF8367000.1 DUF722 domain-containing protein [Weissella paramesenteroides]MDF8375103.1 DUF722 domain-containing protein [Weissella paramesenteroides]
MADKLDHLLTDYFSGKLESEMRLRKLELQYHNNHDENVGGGRMQNNLTRVAETTMIHIESDPKLQLYAYQKEIIETVLSIMPDNVVRVVKSFYGSKNSLIAISMDEHISERTVRA